MAEWKLPDGFAAQSQARLTAMFDARFKQQQALRAEQQLQKNFTFGFLRSLAKNDKDLTSDSQKIAAAARQKSTDLANAARANIEQSKVEHPPRVDITVAPPFNFQWTWNAETGDGTVNVGATASNGNISVHVDSGQDSSAAADGKVAVGTYFHPTVANQRLDILSTPSFNYEWVAVGTFASSHSAAFIGLYVGEYTLQGEFVQAVVDQTISLWDSTGGGDQGSSSGYPLSASILVDSNHFYEIWVWAGSDAEGDGWTNDIFFTWGSYAASYLNIHVPSISLYPD